MTSNCVLCKTKLQTTYLDEIKEKHHRAAATWYQWEKGKDGWTEKNEKKGIFENLLWTLQNLLTKFCCITLLTNCKGRHIMHANWLQHQKIATQRWCRWTSLKTSPVFIRMLFPVPIRKETVSHCTLLWSGSGTKVYQWSFCQVTTIMTRQLWYLTLHMFSTISKNTLETMFTILRSGLMDLPIISRINTSSGLLASPCLSW